MAEAMEEIRQARPRWFRPYAEYRDSGLVCVGAIPAHWRLHTVRRFARSLEQGWSPLAQDREASEEEWAVIKLSAIHAGSFRQDEHKALEPTTPPKPELEIRDGDLLITRANTPALVGDACLVGQTRPRLMLCDLAYRLRVDEARVDPGYLAYWLVSRAGRHQIEVDARGSSRSMVKISQGHIKSWLAGTPPLSEQRAIASFLDRETAKIDGLVAKKERLIELLQEKRTALITRAVTQGLDPNVPMKDSGVKLFRKIPREWATARLRWLMQRVVRPVDVDPGSYYREIGIRSWGRGAFHKEQRLGAHLEDKKVFYVCPGDFVLNIVFAWEGAVAVMSEGESGMIASHRFPTFRHAADNVDLDYLLLFFQSDQGRDLMALHSPGAAGRNKTIRLGAFLDEEIPLPPLVTQRRIVSRVREQEDRMYQLLGKAGELMEYLKEFRTALICAAVTGKIDVRDESA